LWKYEEKHLVKKLPLQNNELQQKSQEEKTHAADNGIKQDVAGLNYDLTKSDKTAILKVTSEASLTNVNKNNYKVKM